MISFDSPARPLSHGAGVFGKKTRLGQSIRLRRIGLWSAGRTDVSDLKVAVNALTPVLKPLDAVARELVGSPGGGLACCPGICTGMDREEEAGKAV